MAETQSSDTALSDSIACRILTISASLDHAISFINRVKRFAADASTASEQDQPLVQSSVPLHTSQSSPNQVITKIPWTISNKYYVANVHFQAHDIKRISVHHAQSVPAVIFVWNYGEPYKDHIQRLSQDLKEHDPEVSLAVRIRDALSIPSPELHDKDRDDDDSDIDDFLSSHGFEFIDVAEDHNGKSALNDEEDGAFSDAIPRLPRVIDALSTIMWPSMQASTVKPKTAARRRDRGGLLDWAPQSQDSSFSAMEDILTRSNTNPTNRGKMQKEMEELTRWLETDDESLRGDPWKLAQPGAISVSPTTIGDVNVSIFDGKAVQSAPELGFDDDFTVFVSAPPESTAPGSRLSAWNDSFEADDASFDTSFEADRLVPTQHAGPLYKSLGSVSDFGGSDDGRAEGEDEEDEDFPTQEEIRATSRRIFGTAGSSTTPALTRTQTARQLSLNLESQSQTTSFSLQQDTPSGTHTDETFISDSQNQGDVDAYDMASFDLSRVLTALQGMKAEIASMEDEGERRRAAAKVALGLVYGLEADAGVNLEAGV